MKVIQSLRAHISETVHARQLDTIKQVYEIICGGSNGFIGYDLG